MVSDKFNICDLIKQQLKEQERSVACPESTLRLWKLQQDIKATIDRYRFIKTDFEGIGV